MKGRIGVEYEAPPDSGVPPVMSTVYSFEANFQDVVRAAARELKASGLEARHVGNEVRFYRPDPGQPRLMRGSALSIWRDTAYGRADGFSRRPGWVAVKVEGGDRPTWFDSFKSWLGF